MQKLLPLLLILFFAACSEGTRREVVNNQYSITVPEGMKPVGTLHEDASLQQADDEKPLYLVVIDESKEEMQKHELDYDLELYYTNIVSRGFIESVDEVSLSEPSRVTINGLPALVSNASGKADTTGVFYKVAVIESPTHFYQVLAWTSQSMRPRQEASMDTIIHSFTELEKQ